MKKNDKNILSVRETVPFDYPKVIEEVKPDSIKLENADFIVQVSGMFQNPQQITNMFKSNLQNLYQKIETY
jgi:hypothetical protein